MLGQHPVADAQQAPAKVAVVPWLNHLGIVPGPVPSCLLSAGDTVEPMKKLLRPHIVAPALNWLVALAFITALACRPGGLVEMPTKDRAIDCTEKVVRERAISAIEDVTGMLTSADLGSPDAWLSSAKSRVGSLASKIGAGGIDAVLCMIGWREQQFTAGAMSNPNDDLSLRASNRARLLLADYGANLKLK